MKKKTLLDPELCRNVASLGDNELMAVWVYLQTNSIFDQGLCHSGVPDSASTASTENAGLRIAVELPLAKGFAKQPVAWIGSIAFWVGTNCLLAIVLLESGDAR